MCSSSSSSSSSNAPPALASLPQPNFISREFEGEPETLILTPLREPRHPAMPRPPCNGESPATGGYPTMPRPPCNGESPATGGNPALPPISSEEPPATRGYPALPPIPNDESPATRLATYHNILQRLGERGVSLRHQYPEVERRLRAFVEFGQPFPPVTIQPRNASTGAIFLCVIMPRLDPSKLELLTRRNSRVVTLDVSPYDGGGGGGGGGGSSAASSSAAKKTGSRR